LFRFRNKHLILQRLNRAYATFAGEGFQSGVVMMQQPAKRKKQTYENPSFKKMDPEDAKKFLVYHASQGDRGAKDILSLIFPESSQNIAQLCDSRESFAPTS
jgi:hypothetical protein